MEQVERKHGNQLSILKIGKVFNDIEENTIDLRAIFQELNIYSNIDDMITTGDILISEQGNLIEKLPIEGTEYIEIEFCTLENEYDKYHRIFFVTAIEKLSEFNDNRRYIIRFSDAMGLINNDTRFAIKYDEKIEDMIQKVSEVINNNSDNMVYKNILKSHDVQDECFVFNKQSEISAKTKYNYSFVVPYWKPLFFIKYVTHRAVSDVFPSVNEYMFSDCNLFQNRKGEFIFTNYKNMFTKPLKNIHNENIVFENKVSGITISQSGVKTSRYPILNYSLPKFFNVQNQKLSGMLGFTDNVTNFLAVSCEPITVTKNDIEDIMDYYNLDLDVEYSPYSAINFSENSIFLYNECGINSSTYEQNYKKFTLPYEKSVALRQLIEYERLDVELSGSSDLDLGQFIRLDLGSMNNGKNNSIIEYIKDIKWVIYSITHTFKNDGTYTTYVKCFTPYLHRSVENSNSAMQKRG